MARVYSVDEVTALYSEAYNAGFVDGKASVDQQQAFDEGWAAGTSNLQREVEEEEEVEKTRLRGELQRALADKIRLEALLSNFRSHIEELQGTIQALRSSVAAANSRASSTTDALERVRLDAGRWIQRASQARQLMALWSFMVGEDHHDRPRLLRGPPALRRNLDVVDRERLLEVEERAGVNLGKGEGRGRFTSLREDAESRQFWEAVGNTAADSMVH
jgi:chromosome segregation ATPase